MNDQILRVREALHTGDFVDAAIMAQGCKLCVEYVVNTLGTDPTRRVDELRSRYFKSSALGGGSGVGLLACSARGTWRSQYFQNCDDLVIGGDGYTSECSSWGDGDRGTADGDGWTYEADDLKVLGWMNAQRGR